jgi:SAM-dependent methyltransferase
MTAIPKADIALARAYPEVGAGGFTRHDGTVEFYGRVNALLQPHFAVLDFGAGRGGWYEDDTCEFRKQLRLLKGKVKWVVGQDIDDAVLTNNAVNERVVTKPGRPLPFPDSTFDIIVADYVFEHVDNPPWLASELTRLLKPGGWICARTPNKWGYISIGTRLIKNAYHARILRVVQPHRKEIDVFPTRFFLNTIRAVSKALPESRYELYSYYYQPEPSYHFHSTIVLTVMRLIDRLLPRMLWSNLYVFARRRL